MKTIEKYAAKIIRGLVSSEEFGWPPVCNGLIYQPERPIADTSANHTVESNALAHEKDYSK